MLRRFRLEEPGSIKEASALLAQYGETANVYAGGTELLLAMKESLVQSEWLINIKGIPEIDQVKLEDGVIRVGALATHRSLEENAILEKFLPAFVTMERNIANVRIREVGTLGGNLCFAEPHSDPAPLLMVLGAKLLLEKSNSQREVPVEQFFKDAFETSLEPAEILTEIRVPEPASFSSSCYLKFGYLERPSVGVALFLRLGKDKKSVAEIKIAVGSAGPRPGRVREAEELIQGKTLDEASNLIGQAGEIAGRVSEAVSDLHGAADYKEHLVRVLLNRAFRGVCRSSGPGKS
ncbi:MAG: FAD binding domain-containing protein [Candidatus Binatia bacterium]